MSPKITKIEPERSKIAVQDAQELKRWAKHLAVTPDRLQAAIDKVGNSAAAVRKHLADQKV